MGILRLLVITLDTNDLALAAKNINDVSRLFAFHTWLCYRKVLSQWKVATLEQHPLRPKRTYLLGHLLDVFDTLDVSGRCIILNYLGKQLGLRDVGSEDSRLG